MNINDIAKPVTAATLNESLEKRFGQRLKLEDFTLEQLQNSRNKIRTKLFQVETNESFDKVHTSETYHKNKLFLDILNAEIAERENIAVAETDVVEGKGKKYKSDAQRKAIHAAKNEDIEVAMRPEVDSHHEDRMQQRQLATIEDAADELGDLIERSEELPEWVKKKIVLATSYIDTARDYMKSAGAIAMPEPQMESVIKEGAEEQAELVMAARSMVDKITSWMEDTGEMQTESTLELGDAIRDEFGEQMSSQFTGMIKPALDSLYSALEQTRESLVSGVRLVAGEEDVDMPGDDLDMDDDLEPTVDQDEVDLDLDEPADLDDEFGAADAAAGADEDAGRARRESIERPARLARLLSSKKK